MGTVIVEGSGGGGVAPAGACAEAGHATIRTKSGNNARPANALQRVIMSDTTTRGIRVEVESEYLADRSDREKYFFAYHVRISNVGSESAQLVSREWIITDADGNVETVKGPGVVGEYPVLDAGESYRYTSFCPLPTSLGTMHGSYTMRTRSGQTFEASIAPFTLAVPGVIN